MITLILRGDGLQDSRELAKEATTPFPSYIRNLIGGVLGFEALGVFTNGMNQPISLRKTAWAVRLGIYPAVESHHAEQGSSTDTYYPSERAQRFHFRHIMKLGNKLDRKSTRL